MRKWFILLLGLVLVGMFWNYQQAGYVDPPSSADYAAGTYIRGTTVYNDINDLYSEFNGSISDTNISATAAIDGSKLADGSIAGDKLSNATISATVIHDPSDTTGGFAHDTFDSTRLLHLLPQEVFTTSIVESCFTNKSIKKAHLESYIPYFAAGSACKKVAYGDARLDYACPVAANNLADTLLPDTSYVVLIDFCDSSDVGDPAFASTPSFLSISPIYEFSTPTYFNKQGGEARRDSLYLLTYHVVYASADSCSLFVHWAGHDTIGVAGYKVFWEARE